MPGSYTVQNAFNAGLLSPLLEGRSDLEFYYRGCATLENFLPLPQGGVESRQGTRFIKRSSKPLGSSDRGGNIRLVPFVQSTEQAYMLEFGNLFVRVFKDGGWQGRTGSSQTIEDIGISGGGNVNIQITGHGFTTGNAVSINSVGGITPDLDGEYYLTKVDNDNFTLDSALKSSYSGTWDSSGTAFEILDITTVFPTADLPNLRFRQSADVLYITDITHATQPYTLTRTSDTAWTMAVAIPQTALTGGPFINRVPDGTTMSPSAVTGSITLTASAATFDSGHVGALFEISNPATTPSRAAAETGSATTSSIQVQEGMRLITSGTWTGTITIERQDNETNIWAQTGPVLKSWSDGTNYDETTEELDTVRTISYRLVLAVTSGTLNYIFSNINPLIRGVVKITAVGSSTSATATVLNKLGTAALATEDWREGAWSDFRGWPGIMTFFQQSTYWGGNSFQPQTIWKSRTGDFTNFVDGPEDNAAIPYTIDSDQVNTIKWLAAHNVLLIGTSQGEWKLQGGAIGDPVTPTNVQILPQSDRGSSNVPAVLFNDAVLFVRRSGTELRELIYSFDNDIRIATDRTIRAEHVLAGGVDEMTKQNDPRTVLWCVLGNDMATFTYDRQEEMFAWALQTFTNGNVKSAAIIPGGTEDEIWVFVVRSIESTNVGYIERFDTGLFTVLEDVIYLDSAKAVSGSAMASISGFEHLEGEQCAVLGDDGTVIYDGSEAASAVASGVITFPGGVTTDKASAGLPYTATMETMPLSSRAGGLQGRKKKVSQVTGKFVKTQNGTVDGNGGSQNLDLTYATTITTKKIPVLNRHDRDAQVKIQQSDPLPMTILSLGIEFEAS